MISPSTTRLARVYEGAGFKPHPFLAQESLCSGIHQANRYRRRLLIEAADRGCLSYAIGLRPPRDHPRGMGVDSRNLSSRNLSSRSLFSEDGRGGKRFELGRVHRACATRH